MKVDYFTKMVFNVLFEKARYTAHPFLRVCSTA